MRGRAQHTGACAEPQQTCQDPIKTLRGGWSSRPRTASATAAVTSAGAGTGHIHAPKLDSARSGKLESAYASQALRKSAHDRSGRSWGAQPKKRAGEDRNKDISDVLNLPDY